MSFSFSLFGLDPEKVTLGIAQALNILLDDVIIKLKQSQGNARHLQAAAQDVEITLSTKNVEAADVLKGNVARPSFVNDLKRELEDLSIDHTGVVFEVSDVKCPKATPPMGGYMVPFFKAGGAVVQFHSYSPMKKK